MRPPEGVLVLHSSLSVDQLDKLRAAMVEAERRDIVYGTCGIVVDATSGDVWAAGIDEIVRATGTPSRIFKGEHPPDYGRFNRATRRRADAQKGLRKFNEK